MQYFEDLELGTLEKFGCYPVTREEVIAFASRYDPQPFHLDDEAASHTFFGKVAASGWHTCAMFMAMQVKEMERVGHQGMGSPGLDELRWHRPVYPGDTLSVEREVFEKTRSRSRLELGIFKSRMRVLNQNGEVVMSFLSTAFIRVRNLKVSGAGE
jgi:acyl dehydratase